MVITIGDLHMKNGKEINGIIMRGLLQCLANTSHEHYALKQNETIYSVYHIMQHILCFQKGALISKKNDSLYIYNTALKRPK